MHERKGYEMFGENKWEVPTPLVYSDRLHVDVHAFVYEDGLCWTSSIMWSMEQYRTAMKDGFKVPVQFDKFTVHLSYTEQLEEYTPEQIANAIVRSKRDGCFKRIRLD